MEISYSETGNEGRGSRGGWIFWLCLLALPVLLWIFHRPLLEGYAGYFIVPADQDTAADALVILSGGDGERVQAGLQRLKINPKAKLVICSHSRKLLGSEKKRSFYAREEAIKKGARAKQILLPPAQESTYDEAQVIRRLARKMGWQKIVIVTGPFHSRRALWVFRKVLTPEKVQVFVYHPPETEAELKVSRWWTREAEFMRVFSESLKTLFYRFKYSSLPEPEAAGQKAK